MCMFVFAWVNILYTILTSHEEPSGCRGEGVEPAVVAGGDLALPESIVVVEAGLLHDERAVAVPGRPLVFIRMDADGLAVLLPDTLAPLVVHFARELHVVALRYLLIGSRGLGESLLGQDCRAYRQRQKRQPEQCHYFTLVCIYNTILAQMCDAMMMMMIGCRRRQSSTLEFPRMIDRSLGSGPS